MKLQFGSSGIRGKYPAEVNPETAFELVRRLAASLGKVFALACDSRYSSPALRAAFLSIALEHDVQVTDYGIVPTPALSFQTRASEADCGIMITASHNPSEYNGFKVFDHQGEAFDDESAIPLQKDTAPRSPAMTSFGELKRVSPLQYEEELSRISFRRKWKLVLDPGNGAASYIAPRIYARVLSKVTAINSLPDGGFSARGSEPTEASMNMLGRAVVETGADMGIGFDGDGDRMVLVDEKGVYPLQDRVLAFYVSSLAKRSKGPFLVPLDTSMAIDEVAEKQGAHLVRGPVGDAKLLREMKASKGTFAGEPSGAWIHPEFNPCPDGVLSGLLLLNAMEETDGPVSMTIDKIPRYHMIRQSVRLREPVTKARIESLAEDLKTLIQDEARVTTKFGLRVSSDESWILVRRSGTEPVLRVTCESKDQGEASRITTEALRLVRRTLRGKSAK